MRNFFRGIYQGGSWCLSPCPTQNDKPTEEWWWHLDKVANQQLSIDLEKGTVHQQSFLSTTVDFQSKEAYDLFLDWSRDKQIVIREKNNGDQKNI